MTSMTSKTSVTSMTFLMYCIDPKDHILKVSCQYLDYWPRYSAYQERTKMRGGGEGGVRRADSRTDPLHVLNGSIFSPFSSAASWSFISSPFPLASGLSSGISAAGWLPTCLPSPLAIGLSSRILPYPLVACRSLTGCAC